MEYLELEENPGYDDYALDYYEPKKRRRRKRKGTALTLNPLDDKFKFTPATIGLLCVAGYFIWCAINRWRTGVWSWQPWQGLLGRRLLTTRTYPRPPMANPGRHLGGNTGVEVVHTRVSPFDETVALIVP